MIIQTIIVTWIQELRFAWWLILDFQTLKASYELAFFHLHRVDCCRVLNHWRELLWANVCRIRWYIVRWTWHIDPHFWICGVLWRFDALLSDWAPFVIDVGLGRHIDIFNFNGLIADISLTGFLRDTERASCLLIWILMLCCGGLLWIASQGFATFSWLLSLHELWMMVLHACHIATLACILFLYSR